MAQVRTSLPFDQTQFNLNTLYFGQTVFRDNGYIQVGGTAYEDMGLVSYSGADGLAYANLIGGQGLVADSGGAVVAGKITGFFQAAGLSAAQYYDQLLLTGISITGAEFRRASLTAGTADDQALLGKALAGNDRFDLGNFSDRMQGRTGHDSMYGNGGNDTLEGGIGNDSLFGGTGADRLIGGTGMDRLTGGAGADLFIFNATAELGLVAWASDTITDFTAGTDRINLSGIDAMTGTAGNQAFVFKGSTGIGTGAEGEISVQIYDRDGTADDVTLIRIDTDADRDAEAVIRLAGLHDLTAAEFIL